MSLDAGGADVFAPTAAHASQLGHRRMLRTHTTHNAKTAPHEADKATTTSVGSWSGRGREVQRRLVFPWLHAR